MICPSDMPVPFRNPHGRFAWGALVLLALTAAPALALEYPRLGLYGSINGEGWPYVSGGLLDPTTLDQVARYHEVVLDASPISEYRPEIAQALRARRPGIRLLAYVLGHHYWQVASEDSLVHYPTRYYRLVRDLDGRLYNKRGATFGIANVNLAKRDAGGRFVMAEALADLFDDAVLSSGAWDGVFLDIFCERISWAQSTNDSIDYVRAGYASIAEFDAGWKAGGDTLVSRLRRLAGESAVLVGNCGSGTRYSVMNGWMRENFPFQGGGNWYENMYRDPGGYLLDDARFRQPVSNWIFTAQAGLDPYDSNNRRKVRFGLGSAALGEGFGVFGPADRNAATAPYHAFWYDEYAVDLATGAASPLLQHTGWLGQPLGPGYSMVWVGTNPDAVTNPGFETDLNGWTFLVFGGVGAILTRDTTTAAVGSASARIDVPMVAPAAYYVALHSTGSIPVSAGQNYSATFWARSSPPRIAEIVAPDIAQIRLLAIDETWRQYQVVFDGTTSTTGKVRFNLGSSTGTVWVDDVHFQQGVTSVRRRDFQNGTVLVNPTWAPVTAPMPAGYRRILGVVDPVVNDGTEASSVTVPNSDARFLLNRDSRAPSRVLDLRVVSP